MPDTFCFTSKSGRYIQNYLFSNVKDMKDLIHFPSPGFRVTLL